MGQKRIRRQHTLRDVKTAVTGRIHSKPPAAGQQYLDFYTLKRDRARSKIMEISRLGVVEMTRKRVRESLVRALRQPCPYCKGDGYILSEVTMSTKALRLIESACVRAPGNRIVVEMNLELAESIQQNHSEQLAELERQHGKRIEVTKADGFHYEEVDILSSLEGRSLRR